VACPRVESGWLRVAGGLVSKTGSASLLSVAWRLGTLRHPIEIPYGPFFGFVIIEDRNIDKYISIMGLVEFLYQKLRDATSAGPIYASLPMVA
jgi:hypothetical protein